MVAVVGAVAVARGRQGLKTLSRGEQEVARSTAMPELPRDHSGVFRHDIEAQSPVEGASEGSPAGGQNLGGSSA
jgi:hypothetical protein